MSTSTLSDNTNIISNSITHRVLVFQGGGALGAYEAGIYKALCKKLREDAPNDNRPLFDIIAGTSAGAINSTLILNHIVQSTGNEDPWIGAAKILENYWNESSTNTFLYENPYFQNFLNTSDIFREGFNSFWTSQLEGFDNLFPHFRNNPYFQPFHFLWFDRLGQLGSAEAFRKYLSWLQFTNFPTGISNVLSGPIYQPDFRFMNPFNHIVKYDNNALVKTIKKYWDYDAHRIKTIDPQPRLLLIAVDIQDANTITFDSYPKKDGHMVSVYGDDDDTKKHAVRYDDGIGIEHLLTTMSSHVRLDFPTLDAVTGEAIDEQIPEGSISPRPYMDGFYLSNTPLREVLQSHRDYWYKVKNIPYEVPSLDIYIGDLYPQKEQGTPYDPDAINNRVQNVLFHDKTKYDEKVTTMVSDYVSIINELMDMVKARDKSTTNEIIYNQLEQKLSTKLVSNNRKGKPRDIRNLLKGRFPITQVMRVVYGESQDLKNSDDIFGKAFDYSKTTINNLIEQGYNDTIAKWKLKLN
ncbi:patatin-like phospholipase family protein [Candidatus Nitrosocosmicus hydrocola]|uniref:patatin-like phospholipase family protein n=1 Tax=Candidatus Nitrosocosmicus hydrocola TaxID=1826872 RepID=UPI0011E6047B|nr:patatin-like phospholipase family protein [Candidatus Nitrosocosmicus hydrocola]